MELLSAALFLNLSESDSWFEAAHFPWCPLSPPPSVVPAVSHLPLLWTYNRRRYPPDILCQRTGLFETLSNFSAHLWTGLLLILRERQGA